MLVVVERRVEDKALQLACVAGAAGAAAPILTFHFFRLRLRRACFSSRGAMEISVRLDTLDSREGTPLWHGRVTPSPDVCETHPSLPPISINRSRVFRFTCYSSDSPTPSLTPSHSLPPLFSLTVPKKLCSVPQSVTISQVWSNLAFSVRPAAAAPISPKMWKLTRSEAYLCESRKRFLMGEWPYRPTATRSGMNLA